MQKWGARCLAVALWLVAASASAVSFTLDNLPAGPVLSDNGQLEFSNFQFFSPFDSVDGGDVTLTVLDDGIELSGPLTVNDDFANFFLLYEVRGVSAGINEVSLQLDSDVDADIFGLVLSTKQILGDRVTRPGKDKKDSFPFEHDFAFGPTGFKTLAHLKTADWQFGKGADDEDCDFKPPLGLGRDGAIRLVEAGFAARESIRVVEGVTLTAFGGSATWRSSTNRFEVVPEPATAGMLLFGLTLLAARARRS